MSRGRHKRNKSWVDRQQRDPFVKSARREGYRSRAVYKLMELDRRDGLLRSGMVVVDLGAAPGGWSQYVVERVGDSGIVVAVDVLPMDPVPGVRIVQGDFSERSVIEQVRAHLGDRHADLVISDMSPNISGIASVDQARSYALGEQAANFVVEVLKPGNHMLVKVFEGEDAISLRRRLGQMFSQCLSRKPVASRGRSRETYLVAKDFRGTDSG
ncbi:MAG: RlmE family RNA methyltransferase [Gammaproteobacteria bacterium]|nr:RlmE family RNA methyltransferase [Gammaproteobacteria bacterium]